MKRYFLLLLVALCVAAHAAPETTDATPKTTVTLPALDAAPDELVRAVTDYVLNVVRTDKDLQNGNNKKAIELVETKALPYFNFERMTALAVGRDWNKATPQQKKQLADLFRDLLVRTYSNALSSYRDKSMRYKPFSMKPGDTDVLVRTEILQPGKRPIPLDYSLNLVTSGDASHWKVYDVVVGGVSLVTNYRDTFTQEVRKGGIDGLIQSLSDRVKTLEKDSK